MSRKGKWKTRDDSLPLSMAMDRIDAPCLFDGPINGEDASAPMSSSSSSRPSSRGEAALHPRQSRLPQGEGGAEWPSELSAPAFVFLPKYSPDLNPIEQVFAKFKDSAAKRRSPEATEAISDASGKISPSTRLAGMRRIPQERRIRR